MPVATEQYRVLSPSSRRAMAFAAAAARIRDGFGSPVVRPDDLLVGVLLSHPDREGEGRVLLGHFGLTARDVLPDDYPQLDPDELRRHTAGLGLDGWPALDPDAERALLGLVEQRDEVHLRHLLGALLESSGPLRDRLAARLEAAGTELTLLVQVYRDWAAEDTRDRSVPAGRRLAELLQQTLPRRPVDVPSYAADRAGGGEDLVGIRREVDAFAYLIAAKAQRPPLAVGLFGDWGSGKSFFMHAVRARIAEIGAQVADRPQAEVPFWKQVRQIEFNAWEYVRGTLWASLLDHIFQELDGRHIDLVTARRAQLQERTQAAQDRAAEQQAEKARLEAEVARRQTALDAAERARSDELTRIRTERADGIAEQLDAAGAKVWGPAAAQLAGRDAAELAGALADARAEVTRGRGLLGAYWTPPRIGVATVVALSVPAIAYAADQADLPPVVSLLGGLSALVPAVTAVLRSATTWTRARLDELDAVAHDIAAEIDAKQRALDAQVATAEAELADSQAALAEVETAERAARDEATTLVDALAGLTPGRVLGEFLQERSRSDDYRSHLGLLAKVREDLGHLEQLVRENNDAGGDGGADAPPNRIVLYIDDLDRCSSEKVVEVLEAVHLLLAFELFVVVVAVDSRWLSFALTDELRALNSTAAGGRPATPQDYLEKIFQLPFWVQPLTPNGRRALVHGLLEGTVRPAGRDVGENGAGPAQRRLDIGPREEELLATMLARRGADPRVEAHVLALGGDDLRFMESLAPLLGDTPRRVKRFVNVTQLLLALPPSLAEDAQSPPDRDVVAFLAALNSGLPGVAPRLFDAVEAGGAGHTLGTLTAGLADAPEDERARLDAWLAERPDWQLMPADRLETRLDVVRRLSFHRR